VRPNQNNMHIYPIHPFLCVTLTWEDPRGDITARGSFLESAPGERVENESGSTGLAAWTRFLDGVEQNKRKQCEWRLSKGSASPRATNDSWRAPVPISGRAASGSSVEFGTLIQDKRKGEDSFIRTRWNGAIPTGNRRVARPRPLQTTCRPYKAL
jgi:hypothetical protein